MEQRLLNEKEFEELWQRAEAARYGERLRRDYTAWFRRRKRLQWSAMAMAACVAAVVVAWPAQSQPQGYDRVYCNRNVQPDSHWADVAAEMLIEY